MNNSITDLQASIKSLITGQATKDEFSGVVLVEKDNEVIFEEAVGYAQKDNGILNTPQTIFNIGSIDKVFTAIAIGQLVQQKKLLFSDLISKYIPNLPSEIADSMKVDLILTHKDGFPSYFNKAYIANRNNLKSVDDFLELFIHEPLLFMPGEKYQYSNSGYVVLGKIIEEITGGNYYEYVKRYIFDIAGMSNTGSFDLNKEGIAHGYTLRKPFSQERQEGERRDNSDELSYHGSPAGGGYSTMNDFLKLSIALREGKLLFKNILDEMLTPRVNLGTKNEQTLYYGYGFQILESKEKYRYGHAGSFAGVNARCDMYWSLGYTVVVLSNYDEPSAFRVANKIGEIIGF